MAAGCVSFFWLEHAVTAATASKATTRFVKSIRVGISSTVVFIVVLFQCWIGLLTSRLRLLRLDRSQDTLRHLSFLNEGEWKVTVFHGRYRKTQRVRSHAIRTR